MHRSRRAAKNGEDLGTLIIWCGRKVDVGRQCPTSDFVHNKPGSMFLTGQVEYCLYHEWLGSCLGVVMKSSMSFKCGPFPSNIHLTSTWRHSHHKISQAFPIFCHSSTSVYYTDHSIMLFNFVHVIQIARFVSCTVCSQAPLTTLHMPNSAKMCLLYMNKCNNSLLTG